MQIAIMVRSCEFHEDLFLVVPLRVLARRGWRGGLLQRAGAQAEQDDADRFPEEPVDRLSVFHFDFLSQ